MATPCKSSETVVLLGKSSETVVLLGNHAVFIVSFQFATFSVWDRSLSGAEATYVNRPTLHRGARRRTAITVA